MSLDSSFDVADAEGGSHLRETSVRLQEQVLPGAAATLDTATLTQKQLSAMVDAAALERLLANQRHDAAFCAHVALCRVPGAGVWLTAAPTEDGRELDAPLAQVAFKRRLRVPLLEADDFCPMCGQVMDKWGDHALTCSCGGDRTVRHNALRNVVFEEATASGLGPEREKAGLLPAELVARRPADVWLPRGPGGNGCALDFAVTSGLRSDIFRPVIDDPSVVFERYEHEKRQHLQTEERCREAGFQFQPMVLEAHGGSWSPSARRVLDWIAQQGAASQGESAQVVGLKIAQRLSCVLHRENARAILRRIARAPAPESDSGWAAASFEWQ